MVGAPRFELGLNPPKGLVLPLHYAPIFSKVSPWQESNPHQRLRRALLYPLSYKGIIIQRNIATLKRRVNNLRSCVLDFLKQSVFIFIMSDYVFKLGAIY